MTEVIMAYNNSIHTATNLTPIELQRAHIIIKSIPSDLSTEEFTKTLQTEYVTRTVDIANKEERQKQIRVQQINTGKEKPPDLKVNDVIYEKLHTRDKTAPKYMKHTITNTNNGPTTSTNKRTIHKRNVKRHSIITGSTVP